MSTLCHCIWAYRDSEDERQRDLWIYQFLTLHGELIRYVRTNQMYRLVWSGLFAQKPFGMDCICGGSRRHMKWISLFWCTIRHPKSTVSRMSAYISFKRIKHYIVRCMNRTRLFGFLWSQRKKCLLLQYNVLILKPQRIQLRAHDAHLACDCEATLQFA